MQVNTKCRYGSRALLELAKNPQNTLSISELAERQDIDRSYLENILNSLKEAGIIMAVRGARGGYKLARSPQSVSMLDIFNILSDPKPAVPCLHEKNECRRNEGCPTRPFWKKLQDVQDELLRRTSLASLLILESQQLDSK